MLGARGKWPDTRRLNCRNASTTRSAFEAPDCDADTGTPCRSGRRWHWNSGREHRAACRLLIYLLLHGHRVTRKAGGAGRFRLAHLGRRHSVPLPLSFRSTRRGQNRSRRVMWTGAPHSLKAMGVMTWLLPAGKQLVHNTHKVVRRGHHGVDRCYLVSSRSSEKSGAPALRWKGRKPPARRVRAIQWHKARPSGPREHQPLLYTMVLHPRHSAFKHTLRK